MRNAATDWFMSSSRISDGVCVSWLRGVVVRAAGERRLSLTVRHVCRVVEEGREVLETAERRREEERRERRFLHSITDHRPDLPLAPSAAAAAATSPSPPAPMGQE